MSRSPISSLVSLLILVAASTLSRANAELKIGERPATDIQWDDSESNKNGDPEPLLKAIVSIQEKPLDANADVKKWVEDCYELANRRGKLISEFYDQYPTHERTTKLLRSRWEDFFGHRRTPSMAQLDMIREDIIWEKERKGDSGNWIASENHLNLSLMISRAARR